MRNELSTFFGDNLMDVFDDFDRNFFRGFYNPERMLYGKNAQRLMKTDVKETDAAYEMDIDLPGFKKDEIQLELSNGYLTVSTQKALEKADESKGRMLRQERYSGTMQRSFYVGDALTQEDIKAAFENGVLHITVPKKDTSEIPAKKTILIEG